MRGYFGVGVDGISKPMNLGNLVRIAHAFDASFFFSIAPRLKLSDAQSDTSRAAGRAAFLFLCRARRISACRWAAGWWGWRSPMTPSNCRASAIPSAAPMSSGRSVFRCRPQVLKACEFVVKIPTRFSINVGMAGAIVLYDRLLKMGGYGRAAGGGGRQGRGSAAPA